ncbi:MAG: DsbA family protein [Proteobacteria bacterium]|nr:DsbA family protein [Pseudomonadota bacterium]
MLRRQFISYTMAATALSSTSLMAQDAKKVVEMTLGNPDATVTVTEYASFTCPHCATFHTDVMPNLKADYIDTGKIKFIYREVYFDRLGLWGGMLARCGGPERYFGIIDMLYKRQREWTKGSGAEIAENLYKIGRIAGLKNKDMEACLQDQDMAKALVADFQKNAGDDNVDSTPTLLINGVKHGNQSYSDLQELLDAQLES